MVSSERYSLAHTYGDITVERDTDGTVRLDASDGRNVVGAPLTQLEATDLALGLLAAAVDYDCSYTPKTDDGDGAIAHKLEQWLWDEDYGMDPGQVLLLRETIDRLRRG